MMDEQTPHLFDLPGGGAVDLRYVTGVDVIESANEPGSKWSFRVFPHGGLVSRAYTGHDGTRGELQKVHDQLKSDWRKIQALDWS